MDLINFLLKRTYSLTWLCLRVKKLRSLNHGGGPSSRGVSVRRDGPGYPRTLRRGCRETGPPLLPRPIQVSLLACSQRHPTRRLPRFSVLSPADISGCVGRALEWGRSELGSSRQNYRIDKVSSTLLDIPKLYPISFLVCH